MWKKLTKPLRLSPLTSLHSISVQETKAESANKNASSLVSLLLLLLTLTSLVCLRFDDHVAICWLLPGSAGRRADQVDGSGSGRLVRGAIGFGVGAAARLSRSSAAQTETP